MPIVMPWPCYFNWGQKSRFPDMVEGVYTSFLKVRKKGVFHWAVLVEKSLFQ
jgi:hypothetical protein